MAGTIRLTIRLEEKAITKLGKLAERDGVTSATYAKSVVARHLAETPLNRKSF